MNDLESKSESEQQPKKISTSESFHHLLLLAVIAGGILFLLCLVVPSAPLALIPIVSTVAATVLLVAVWSVFGPGSYLTRNFWAHSLGAIVALGALLSALIHGLDDPKIFQLGFFWTGVITVLLAIPMSSIAAQAVFWLLRACFGWQIVFRDSELQPAFQIKDVFAFTFLFALALAAPQISIALNNADSLVIRPMKPGMLETVEVRDDYGNPVYDSNGEIKFEQIPLTQERYEQSVRQAKLEMRETIFYAYGVVASISIVLAFASLPILCVVFRIQPGDREIFLLTYIMLGIGVCIFFAWLFPLVGNAVFMSAILLALWSVVASAFSVAMWISRENGFRLTSVKMEARKTKSVEVDPGKDQLHALD